jgi:hypothetical protein
MLFFFSQADDEDTTCQFLIARDDIGKNVSFLFQSYA